MATIADVARQAGVSLSTVSHVVNGTRRVAPQTARAVQAAIDSIGYSPNVLARALKTASTRSVGVAISAIANPYFSDIICAIETECARLGMMVFLSDTQDDPARELEVVTALHQRRVDGVILAPSADPERRALAYLRAAQLPCVLVDRMPDPAFDQVGVNNREAMRDAGRIMSPASGIGASATSAAIRISRPRWSASPATATPCAPRASLRRALSRHRQRVDRERRRRDACAARLCPFHRRRSSTGNNMATIGAMRALRERGLERSRRHFDRRLRRLRMGRLFRAAADACRPALRGNRPARGVPADGADRRARRRAAHGAARRHARSARLLCEAAMTRRPKPRPRCS